MKKFVAGLLCGAALMLSTSVFADGALQQITAYLTPDVSVELDGQRVALQNAPVNYDGSTYLPVRELAGAVGLSVEWDPNSRTAKLNSGKSPAIAEPGSTTPASPVLDIVEDNTYLSDATDGPTLIIDGVRFLPLRSGIQKYNISFHDITFDQSTKTYSIKGKTTIIHISDTPSQNAEAFIRNDVTYVREGLFTAD